MKRVLTIDLDYDLGELRENPPEGSRPVPSNSEITRNIIENTYARNHPEMGVKEARKWRRIVKTIEKALQAGEGLVVISDEDLTSLLEEIGSCQYDQTQAFIVPVLFDELERIRDLPKKETLRALEELEKNREATDQVNKVLEMSQ